MDKIKNFFDDFTFHARVMPIMVVSLPIALMAISKGVLQGDWPKNAGLILLSLVFFTMTSKIARNLGKSYEKKMYQQLGGMPSTIVFACSRETFLLSCAWIAFFTLTPKLWIEQTKVIGIVSK